MIVNGDDAKTVGLMVVMSAVVIALMCLASDR